MAAPVGLGEVAEGGVDPVGPATGAWKISSGKTVKATGTETSGVPLAAGLWLPSQ